MDPDSEKRCLRRARSRPKRAATCRSQLADTTTRIIRGRILCRKRAYRTVKVLDEFQVEVVARMRRRQIRLLCVPGALWEAHELGRIA